jgi:hypothetical protein
MRNFSMTPSQAANFLEFGYILNIAHMAYDTNQAELFTIISLYFSTVTLACLWFDLPNILIQKA